MKLLSIVVTLYNQQEELAFFFQNMIKDLHKLSVNYEYIFIDNGSHDGTLAILRSISEKDFHCHYISMKHNISVIESFYIGMQHAQGDDIMMMDIQHPTYMIVKLYEIMEEKKVTDVGGILHKKNTTAKKQKHLRIIHADKLKDYFEQQDLEGFKSYLNHPQEKILWLPYTNMEETKGTHVHSILSRLNLKYERHMIYALFCASLCTLIMIPSILIFYYRLDFAYCIYIALLLTICAFILFEVIHSRYCCFQIVKRHQKIKESTF